MRYLTLHAAFSRARCVEVNEDTHSSVFWGFLVKGVNLGGFDLGCKLWGFLTVGVHFEGF